MSEDQVLAQLMKMHDTSEIYTNLKLDGAAAVECEPLLLLLLMLLLVQLLNLMLFRCYQASMPHPQTS